jgi:hypothetical protein
LFAPADEWRAAGRPGVWSSVPRPILREETLRPPRSLGNPLAYTRRSAAEGYRGIAAYLNRAGERCRREDLVLAYHNHPVELAFVEGRRTGYDILLEGTDRALVSFEIDLAWIVAGGADPRAFFASHPGRFPLWHAKDVNERGEDLDLGHGVVDSARSSPRPSVRASSTCSSSATRRRIRSAPRGYRHLARWWATA